MGDDFASNSTEVLILLSIFYFLTTSTTIPINMAYGMEKSKFIAFFSLFCIITCMSLIYPLTTKFGLSGILYSMLLSQIQAPILIIYLSKKILHINPLYLFKNVFIFPIIWSVICLIIFYFSIIFEIKFNILNTLVYVGLFSIFYFLSMFSFKWIKLDELKLIVKEN